MSDLASQSLGYTEQNKISLVERRALYADWLASGRRIPLSTGAKRVDDVPTEKELKRPEVGTINPLPPGAVVRTDEGDEIPDLSDDVRLGFAKTLLKKAENSTPEEATRIANAAQAILGPIKVRADDDKKADENLKKTVTGQQG